MVVTVTIPDRDAKHILQWSEIKVRDLHRGAWKKREEAKNIVDSKKREKLLKKASKLALAGCAWADFTRELKKGMGVDVMKWEPGEEDMRGWTQRDRTLD